MVKARRLLICENKVDTAVQLKKVFERQYNVSIGYDVNQCLTLLRERRSVHESAERFAVAIIDLSFPSAEEPNTEGFQTLREVRRDPFLEPVIYTGTGEDVEKAIRSHELGAFRYIMKCGEAQDGKALNSGSIANLKRAVADAFKCWQLLVELDMALGQLSALAPNDRRILPIARSIFDHIQRIRGR